MTNKIEAWKDINGYEGLYQAGDLGHIKSLRSGNILHSYNDGCGYRSLTLYKNKKKITKKIHRLIAETFVENKLNKLEVNHKNGDKSDNRAENLEWVTRSENVTHGFRQLGRINPWKNKFGSKHNRSKLVSQYSKDGKFIASFGSIKEAERKTKITRKTISENCQQKRISKYFIWKYD